MSYFSVKNGLVSINQSKRKFRKSRIEGCFIMTTKKSLIKITEPCDIKNNHFYGPMDNTIKGKIDKTITALNFIWSKKLND